MWLYFQNVWTQWKLGVIEDGVWSAYQKVICGDLVGTNDLKQWWKSAHAYALSDDFVSEVEGCPAATS